MWRLAGPPVDPAPWRRRAPGTARASARQRRARRAGALHGVEARPAVGSRPARRRPRRRRRLLARPSFEPSCERGCGLLAATAQGHRDERYRRGRCARRATCRRSGDEGRRRDLTACRADAATRTRAHARRSALVDLALRVRSGAARCCRVPHGRSTRDGPRTAADRDARDRRGARPRRPADASCSVSRRSPSSPIRSDGPLEEGLPDAPDAGAALVARAARAAAQTVRPRVRRRARERVATTAERTDEERHDAPGQHLDLRTRLPRGLSAVEASAGRARPTRSPRSPCRASCSTACAPSSCSSSRSRAPPPPSCADASAPGCAMRRRALRALA
jgi:hypothetical protein